MSCINFIFMAARNKIPINPASVKVFLRQSAKSEHKYDTQQTQTFPTDASTSKIWWSNKLIEDFLWLWWGRAFHTKIVYRRNRSGHIDLTIPLFCFSRYYHARHNRSTALFNNKTCLTFHLSLLQSITRFLSTWNHRNEEWSCSLDVYEERKWLTSLCWKVSVTRVCPANISLLPELCT
jgi:hypothetical protein